MIVFFFLCQRIMTHVHLRESSTNGLYHISTKNTLLLFNIIRTYYRDIIANKQYNWSQDETRSKSRE
jgi:hypothetical protein